MPLQNIIANSLVIGPVPVVLAANNLAPQANPNSVPVYADPNGGMIYSRPIFVMLP